MPEQYRKEGHHLYLYSEVSRGYVRVYQDPHLKTLEALVRAYEESLLRDFDDDVDY